MKAFILIISLGVSWSVAADDGPWYDYQGNQVRPAAQQADVVAVKPTAKVVQDRPALGDQLSWGDQRRRQRSGAEKIFYLPPHWGHGCRLPSAHHQPNIWRFRYRAPGVNIVIGH